MKMFPNNLSFKKYHKADKKFLHLLEQKSFFPFFFQYGVKADEPGKITYKQIEAFRRTLRRGLGKKGFYKIKIFTYSPVTSKPISSRMGSGKGGISYWIAPIKKGQVLFEINCASRLQAEFVLIKASTKLPIKTRIVKLKY